VLKQSKRRFDAVLLSCERDEAAFNQQVTQYPGFLAVPYDSPQRNAALRHFNISAIPRLIILDPFGDVLVDNALGASSGGGLSVENVDKWLNDARPRLYGGA